ncbi:YbdK family carboxylate-amine ligase [Persephonella atlantica]|uniref:Putative glutamate--cysteine ligase 2 n=1 Tax=Persephonella atlantica TaxID=2699429 RepID=A0ABS1GJG8_9AQUI|nr:YbdK family carboxylate-amine ligase [Persephonella atlantica]MBK3333074.1 YbdK family carboxylate-amine ligase [Persephonella atlantica]
MKFKSSKPFTVGAELEVQLVNRTDFSLSNSSDVIFEHLPERLKSIVQPEVLTSMVEIVTPVCEKPEEVVSYFREALHEIDRIGEGYGFRSSALGTHTFAKKEQTQITAKDRYLKLLEELQILLRQFLIYGLHVHVGFPDREMAVRGYNMTINYLPVFLALSTSSPFFYGEFTGLHSYRTKIFEQLPRAGIPEYFDSFSQFEELFYTLKNGGFIESIKDIWWDVRIHPDLGTVELRVCDANPEMDRIELIISLFQGLCLLAQEEKTERYFHQILKQNKWNATRYSLDGKFIEKDRIIPLREKSYSIIKYLEKKGIFKTLNIEKRIKRLHPVIGRKTISERMIAYYRRTGDMKAVEKMGFIR